MNLKDVVSWMAEEGYIVMHKNRYLLSAKFNKDMTGEDVGIQVIDKPVVKEQEPEPDWVALFQKLIMEANVPRTSDNGKGGQYIINTTTKPGREAFKKAIKEGETYEGILQSLKNYYGVAESFKVKVERFFVDEVWRSYKQVNKQSGGTRPKFF